MVRLFGQWLRDLVERVTDVERSGGGGRALADFLDAPSHSSRIASILDRSGTGGSDVGAEAQIVTKEALQRVVPYNNIVSTLFHRIIFLRLISRFSLFNTNLMP